MKKEYDFSKGQRGAVIPRRGGDGMSILAIHGVPDEFRQDVALGVNILKNGGCKEVYIFGSIAENRVRPESDIDFAVRGCPVDRFFKLQGRLLVELAHSADLVDLDADPDLAAFLERETVLVHVG